MSEIFEDSKLVVIEVEEIGEDFNEKQTCTNPVEFCLSFTVYLILLMSILVVLIKLSEQEGINEYFSNVSSLF